MPALVVLTGPNISARKLGDQLRRGNTLVSCYDAGVEMFDYDGTSIYRDDSAGEGGEAELTAWLKAEGGVLVTNENQFRGTEADFVIFVTKSWSDYNDTNSRSPVTRAVHFGNLWVSRRTLS